MRSFSVCLRRRAAQPSTCLHGNACAPSVLLCPTPTVLDLCCTRRWQVRNGGGGCASVRPGRNCALWRRCAAERKAAASVGGEPLELCHDCFSSTHRAPLPVQRARHASTRRSLSAPPGATLLFSTWTAGAAREGLQPRPAPHPRSLTSCSSINPSDVHPPHPLGSSLRSSTVVIWSGWQAGRQPRWWPSCAAAPSALHGGTVGLGGAQRSTSQHITAQHITAQRSTAGDGTAGR